MTVQKIQKRAGDYAIKLGLELHADVMALHVVPASKHFPEENLEKGTKHDYAYLDKIAEQSISAGVDLEIEIIRAQSSVVNEITEYADKKNIDLISHRYKECLRIPIYAW